LSFHPVCYKAAYFVAANYILAALNAIKMDTITSCFEKVWNGVLDKELLFERWLRNGYQRERELDLVLNADNNDAAEMQQCRVEEVDEVIKLTEQGLVIEASSEEEDLEAENLSQQQA